MSHTTEISLKIMIYMFVKLKLKKLFFHKNLFNILILIKFVRTNMNPLTAIKTRDLRSVTVTLTVRSKHSKRIN